jgi:hypothetical protein
MNGIILKTEKVEILELSELDRKYHNNKRNSKNG